ncbi:MAG: hypothetical protein WCA28_09885, partial [Bradyrhizobium sp.]
EKIRQEGREEESRQKICEKSFQEGREKEKEDQEVEALIAPASLNCRSLRTRVRRLLFLPSSTIALRRAG